MGGLGELWYREWAGIHVLSGYCERYPPIQGKVTFVQLPQPLATIFPADAKTADNSVTVSFGNAGISNQGRSLLKAERYAGTHLLWWGEPENSGLVLLLGYERNF